MKIETLTLPVEELTEREAKAVSGGLLQELLAKYAPEVPAGSIPTSFSLPSLGSPINTGGIL